MCQSQETTQLKSFIWRQETTEFEWRSVYLTSQVDKSVKEHWCCPPCHPPTGILQINHPTLCLWGIIQKSADRSMCDCGYEQGKRCFHGAGSHHAVGNSRKRNRGTGSCILLRCTPFLPLFLILHWNSSKLEPRRKFPDRLTTKSVAKRVYFWFLLAKSLLTMIRENKFRIIYLNIQDSSICIPWIQTQSLEQSVHSSFKCRNYGSLYISTNSCESVKC